MAKNPAAVSLGRRGGHARAAKLDDAQRKAIATKASQAAARVRTAKAQARNALPPKGLGTDHD